MRLVASKNGNEGLIESALGKQPPKEVGYPKRDKKSIRDFTCPKKISKHHVSPKPGDPRKQGHTRYHSALGGDVLRWIFSLHIVPI